MKKSIKTKLDNKANKRDGYKCVHCGKTTAIETHHVIPELEQLDNLITLCHGCHKKQHNMAGCFGQGDAKDSKRGIYFKENNGGKYKFEKGIYFNRHIMQWVGK